MRSVSVHLLQIAAVKQKPPIHRLYVSEFLKAANEVDTSKL